MLWKRKSGPNAKPDVPFLRNKNRKHFRQILLVLFLFLFVTLSLQSISLHTQRLEKRLAHHTGQKIRRQSNVHCSNLKRIKICSHQILNPPGSGSDGSLQAMTSLWNEGIHCFDVDAVTLKSGELLAAHPSRFAAKIQEYDTKQSNVKPQDFTLEDARKAGVNEEAFPLLNTLFNHYASLLKQQQQGAPFFSEQNQNSLEGPLLNIDLKGPHLTESHLQSIQKSVKNLGIQNNVAIVATSLEDGQLGPGVDILRYFEQSNDIPLGLVLRDRETQDWDMNQIQSIVKQNQAIRLFVPSFKFKISWFDKLQKNMRLPVVVWTVDDKEDLIHAVKGGVSAVVSNHPLKLVNILTGLLEEKCNV